MNARSDGQAGTHGARPSGPTLGSGWTLAGAVLGPSRILSRIPGLPRPFQRPGFDAACSVHQGIWLSIGGLLEYPAETARPGPDPEA